MKAGFYSSIAIGKKYNIKLNYIMKDIRKFVKWEKMNIVWFSFQFPSRNFNLQQLLDFLRFVIDF